MITAVPVYFKNSQLLYEVPSETVVFQIICEPPPVKLPFGTTQCESFSFTWSWIIQRTWKYYKMASLLAYLHQLVAVNQQDSLIQYPLFRQTHFLKFSK